MSTVSNSNILGQYEQARNAATGGKSRTANDKDTFLKLLITQLTHQDPLNPAEDKEFIAQLAQFTSLEELQKINTSIEALQKTQSQQQIVNAASLMGAEISAKGDMVTKKIGKDKDGKEVSSVSSAFASFPKNAKTCIINIYSTNPDGSIGKLIRSSDVGAQTAGRREFKWDGLNDNGDTMPAGTYVMSFSAKDDKGASMLVETSSVGVVVGVQVSPDGNHYLYLADGRTVQYNNVEFITYPVEQKTEEEKKTEETKKAEEAKKAAAQNNG